MCFRISKAFGYVYVFLGLCVEECGVNVSNM